MKKYLVIAFAALILACLPSCHREDPELDLDTAAIAVPAQGGSATVSFNCNYKWTASSSAPWIKLSATSGEKGSNAITVTVEANTGTSARNGAVDIDCDGLSRTIRISQVQPFSQTLSLVFSGSFLRTPKIIGNGLTAEIDWGDGSTEAYSPDLKHTYASAGQHTVTIKLAGGSSFEIGTVAGISEIDLTEF
ncbi:MAG: hypothetical protein IJ636_04320 [Bacteroidales bacterium]|nr:hypothetical protein [Bacteroidales bacterium]